MSEKITVLFDIEKLANYMLFFVCTACAYCGRILRKQKCRGSGEPTDTRAAGKSAEQYKGMPSLIVNAASLDR